MTRRRRGGGQGGGQGGDEDEDEDDEDDEVEVEEEEQEEEQEEQASVLSFLLALPLHRCWYACWREMRGAAEWQESRRRLVGPLASHSSIELRIKHVLSVDSPVDVCNTCG